MSFVLEVKFGGLCALVPEPNGERAWILMPEWAAADIADTPEHRAVIAFDLDDIEGVVGGRTGWGVLELLKEHVEIVPPNGVAAGSRLYLDGFATLGVSPELRTTARGSISWLAPVETASRSLGLIGAGEVDSALLKPQLTGEPYQRLAARVLLSQGNLSAGALSNQDGDLIVWEFRPAGRASTTARHQQVLAGEIVWTQQIDASWVELVTTDLRTGEVNRHLRLRPADGERVVIYVMNEEAEAILEMDRGRSPRLQLGRARLQDRVFESFYQLSAAPPSGDQRAVPVPVGFLADPHLPPGVGPSVNSPPCSPGLMRVKS